MRIGLFLNAGAFPGYSHAQIYDLLLAEAELAEQLGFHDLWLTEHHFIDFGINSSSLTAAAYLLGHTRTLRVGTAVVLSPQYHPVQLAEQAAILDQLSHGRFDLGIGRGGYKLDFDIFGQPAERWENEVHATAEIILNVWRNAPATSSSGLCSFEDLTVNPRPRTQPHPPLFIASGGGESLALAARNGLPIQHYFATPAEARIGAEQRYRDAAEAAGRDPSGVEHLHCLIVFVTERDEDEARGLLIENMTYSFHTGNQPSLAPERVRRDADGNPIPREELARYAAQSAIVGTPERVVEQMTAFIEQTGARRIALFHELAVEPDLVLASIAAFGEQVAPALRARFETTPVAAG